MAVSPVAAVAARRCHCRRRRRDLAFVAEQLTKQQGQVFRPINGACLTLQQQTIGRRPLIGQRVQGCARLREKFSTASASPACHAMLVLNKMVTFLRTMLYLPWKLEKRSFEYLAFWLISLRKIPMSSIQSGGHMCCEPMKTCKADMLKVQQLSICFKQCSSRCDFRRMHKTVPSARWCAFAICVCALQLVLF